MQKKGICLGVALSLAVSSASALEVIRSGPKLAAFLSMLSIMISLPAFVSLYIHIRRTNLGKAFIQPLLAMFVGFVGIMINSLIDVWRILNGVEVDNRTLIMGINSSISAVLISLGAVIMFFSFRNHGLFELSYYQKKAEDTETPAAEKQDKAKPDADRAVSTVMEQAESAPQDMPAKATTRKKAKKKAKRK